MRFELVKTFDGVSSYYGNIPDTFHAPAGISEKTGFTLEDQRAIVGDFVAPINDVCGSCLDAYDVEYFDAKQCEKLMEWLEDRLQAPCSSRLRHLYDTLLEYAKRAVELGTGVIVEL